MEKQTLNEIFNEVHRDMSSWILTTAPGCVCSINTVISCAESNQMYMTQLQNLSNSFQLQSTKPLCYAKLMQFPRMQFALSRVERKLKKTRNYLAAIWAADKQSGKLCSVV